MIIGCNLDIDWVEPERTGRVVLALRGCPDAGLGDGDGLPLLLLLEVEDAARLRVLRQELRPRRSGQVVLVTLLLRKH